MLKDTAGVHHGFIEEKGEHVVTEIVMCGNVSAAALMAVPPEKVHQLVNWPGQPRHTAVDAVEYVTISYEESNQRCQVIDLPESLHVGFAGGDTATKNNITPEPAVTYRNPNPVWKLPRLSTKLIDPIVFNDNELSKLYPAEQIQ